MKKNILILVIFIIFSCKNSLRFYDINGPVLEFYDFINSKDLLFQFNEPVERIKFLLNDGFENKLIEYKSIFPKANFIFKESLFEKKSIVEINSFDTSGNCSKTNLNPIVINDNPAKVEFDEISLKHSKKYKQSIILKITKQGLTDGFKFIIMKSGSKIIIPFKNEKAELNNRYNIIINLIKKNAENNNCLTIQDKYSYLNLKQYLSQSYSLLLIVNNKNELCDCLLYYNSKNKKTDYKNNKNYCLLKNELKKFNINSEGLDIADCTVKKIIKKTKEGFKITGK